MNNRLIKMIIDHICIAVKKLDEAISYWDRVFGYKQMTEVAENSLQKVKVVFLYKKDSLTIKLIEPFADNDAMMNFVKGGGGFHHVCFKCDNLDEQVREFTKEGLLTLSQPQPGEAFNGHNIAFMLAKYGLRIELIDTEEKAGLLPGLT